MTLSRDLPMCWLDFALPYLHIYDLYLHIYISTYLGRLRGSTGGSLQGGQPLVPGGHYQLGHRVRRAKPARRLHQVQRENIF